MIYKNIALSFMVTFVITACGGGGGGSTSSSTSSGGSSSGTSFVSSISPSDGETSVATNTKITATFSEDMLATSIDNNSFTLVNGNLDIPAGVIFDALSKTTTLTPIYSLGPLQTFTANLANTITNLSGSPLTSTSWSFTTSDGTWGTPELIEMDDTGDTFNPEIASDKNGNLVVAWMQYDINRSYFNIWANTYTPSAGWGTAQQIETNNAGDAYDPKVALDDSGNATVVWRQHDGTRYNILANRYEVGAGWGAATLIETSSGLPRNQQVVVDPSGNATAIWQQPTGGADSIWVNRFDINTGWGAAFVIENNNVTASYPQLAVNASGDTVAIWVQNNRATSNNYTNGSGWGTAVEIGVDNQSRLPTIAIDNDGNVTAVWQVNEPVNVSNRTWGNKYTPADGWGTAVPISTISPSEFGGSNRSNIAMDSNGNAIAIWHEYNGSSYSVMANRYTATTGWGAADNIITNKGDNPIPLEIVIDANGNAIVTSAMSDGSASNIWFNRYVAGSGWGTASNIDNGRHTLAIDGNGKGVLVMVGRSISTGGSGPINIWSMRFE